MAILQPDDDQALQVAVEQACAEGHRLEVVGAGTKRALGRPVVGDDRLDLSRLAGVIDYEPAELVLTAKPGTRLAEVETLLEGAGQALAFEPPDLSELFGAEHAGTLGGVISANLSGPRRIKAGAARDHLLGFQGVTGHGRAFKSGGRVVKNVTGYDLSKLITGSMGTLAALAEVSIKTLPRAEATWTLVLRDLDDRRALAAMTKAMASAHEVSGAAHLPAGAPAALGFGSGGAHPRPAGRASTIGRGAIFRPSPGARRRRQAGGQGVAHALERGSRHRTLDRVRRSGGLAPLPAARGRTFGGRGDRRQSGCRLLS